MMRIGITGPESSGKTELSLALAEALNAGLVSEYARPFLEEREGRYIQTDLDIIAKQQYLDILNCDDSRDYWVIDTEMLVMKVWSEYKFKSCSPLILEKWQQQPIDLYLLCKPDFPWQPDPLREHPEERENLYVLYEANLKEAGHPFLVIEGNFENRLQTVLQHLGH